ncbi:MAG: inorganic triphosphatase, partial [Proteobacteria bacterium]|nr:inorganic triphosphatase [Burkholderiales bacterium]
MPVETELRFQLNAAQARALGADPRLAGKLQRRPLTSVYFDTPELTLAQRRVGLRLRRAGRVWLQTFKCELVDAGAHQRGEWEWPVARAALDFTKLAETPLADWFVKARNRDALAPRFETRFARSTALIDYEDASIEVALDRGKLIAGERQEAILELELELKSGPIEGLYAAAQAFNADHALMLEPRSKAARGFALLAGTPEVPVKSGRLDLDEEASAEEAFCAVIRHCLAHLQANAGGVRRALDPEYVHQARVALRRLRSALVTFRRAIPRVASDALGA